MNLRDHLRIPLLALTVAGVCAACGTSADTHSAPSATRPTAGPTAGPTASPTATPVVGDFVDTIDNPWLPLAVGTRWRFVGRTPHGVERDVVTVTDRTKTVAGVEATVVHDVVRLDGRLSEETFDWYAQDSAGNVWYLGEATQEHAADGTVSTAGSWEAGVRGARAGIAMLARPTVGAAYRQEYDEGNAEDEAEVISLDGSATVPYGHLTGLLQTRDFTGLEPDADEHKYYARGVGVVLEEGLHEKERNELVSMTRR
jgi:hypothetical protein